MKILNLVLLLIGLLSVSCGQEKMTNQALQQETSMDGKSLIATLDSIGRVDREPLVLRDSMSDLYGPESKEAQFYQEIAWKNQSSNTKEIIEILGKDNWPDSTRIGAQGNEIICTILQHSDQVTREHYIPRMKQAVMDGKLEARWLVRAEDRIATDKGELQIYGGQMKYYPETKSFNVWPVLDPVNIDKRRAEIGLIPIAEHLKNRFDFDWNLDDQLERSKEFELEKIKSAK